jgi:hypothetical protein
MCSLGMVASPSIERTTGFANDFVSFGDKWLVAAHVVADLVVWDCEM